MILWRWGGGEGDDGGMGWMRREGGMGMMDEERRREMEKRRMKWMEGGRSM